MKNDYSDLLGLTKKEVTAMIGDEFNFYPDDIWIYLVNRNFFGRKTFLIVEFDKNRVIQIRIKKTYGTINKAEL